MCSSGPLLFLGWHYVDSFALQPQQHGELYVSSTACRLPYECFPVLSVPWPSTFTYDSSILLQNRAGSSSLWHLTITEYCVLSIMRSLLVARDGAVEYQCSDSRIIHLSRVVLVPLPARLQSRVHEHGFRHLIDGPAFNYASASTLG